MPASQHRKFHAGRLQKGSLCQMPGRGRYGADGFRQQRSSSDESIYCIVTPYSGKMSARARLFPCGKIGDEAAPESARHAFWGILLPGIRSAASMVPLVPFRVPSPLGRHGSGCVFTVRHSVTFPLEEETGEQPKPVFLSCSYAEKEKLDKWQHDYYE